MDQIRHILRNRKFFNALADRRVRNALDTLNRLAQDAASADVVPIHRIQLFEAVLCELVALLRDSYGIEGVEEFEAALQDKFETRIAV